MNKLISIIVPIYNIEGNVRQCIESLIKQSYIDLEIILVDDGSTDKSGKICDEYAKKNKKIRVIHQKNCGLSGARNAGIDASLGSMIMFVDGDDIIDERMTEILEKDLNSTADSLFSSCWFQRIKKYEMKPVNDTYTKSRSSDDVLHDLISGKYENISAWGKLYKKNTIGDLRFSDGRIYFEDKVFLLQLLLNNRGKVILERPDKLYGYFIRSNSITASKYNNHTMDILYHSRLMLDLINKDMPEYVYLGMRNDVVAHLMVLKNIIRSRAYIENRLVFSSVKRDLFTKYGNMPRKLLGSYRNELNALKIGDLVYIICVYVFDGKEQLFERV